MLVRKGGMMKKRVITFFLCTLAAFSLVGCGSDAQADTETESAAEVTGLNSLHMDIDIEKQVKSLCDYNGIDLTITGDYEVSDEDVESSVLELLPSYGITGIEVTDHDTVREDDLVLIDYTGYKDGEAFDGGSATDVMFDVANNYDVTSQYSYIDGFADGLIGAKVGGTAKSEVTFPDDYGSEDLAGQPATFEFNVKGIYEAVTMDNLTDDMVAEAFEEDENGITTKAELKEYVRGVLESQQETYKNQDKVTAAEDYMIANSEVDIPDDYLLARLSEYQASFERDYCSDGQTLEEFLSDNGMDYDSMTETWTESLKSQLQTEFIFGRIADLEGIEADDDNFAQFVSYIISSGNIDASSAEEVYEYYGLGNKEDGEQSLRQLFRVNQAISFVVENANVTVEPAADDTGTTE
jgi:trigger factor